jgi:hypothetical protein
VSKRLTAPYRSGPSRDWIKVKNPDSPAMVRPGGAMVSPAGFGQAGSETRIYFRLRYGCESDIFYSALLSHFPDERATVPGPQPFLPVRLGFSGCHGHEAAARWPAPTSVPA